MYELRVVVDGFETLRQRLSVESEDLNVAPLALKAKPWYDLTTEVLGIAEDALPTLTPTAAMAPTTTPTPGAGVSVQSAPSTAAPPSKPAPSSPTRVIPATATKVVISTAVPTATLRPQGIVGIIGPVLNSIPTPKPTYTATRSATLTPTRTSSPTPVATAVLP